MASRGCRGKQQFRFQNENHKKCGFYESLFQNPIYNFTPIRNFGAFLALPRQKPGLHGRAVFLYPLRGYKNTTSRAFRSNSSAPAGLAGFPLQSLAPHGLFALRAI
jgi:hypothetical protein